MVKRNLFYNGKIYPFGGKPAAMQAMAVEDGWIVELGTNVALKPLARRGFKAIDLNKQCVIPGMIDAHLHLLNLGRSFSRVQLDGVKSLTRVKSILTKAASKLGPDEWLLGRGWNKNLWGDDFPDKTLLDEITSNPVVLNSKDGHLLWVNSTALRYCRIDRNTPDPPGGQISRDAHGEPSGILKENADEMVFSKIPPEPFERKLSAILEAQKQLLKLGITGVGDCDADSDQFTIYHDLDQAGKLYLRVFKMIPQGALQRAIDFKFHTGFGSEHLRTGCLKLFADGALGSQTALMFKPYENRADNYGVETLTTSQLDDLIGRATTAGISVAIHAIGDKANYQALRAIARSGKAIRKYNLRPRIEHAQVLRKNDIALFARYGIIASVQPIHATSDRDIADRYWGARSEHAYPFKTFLRSGARMAFGSDAPIEDASPIAGIHAAVTRKRASEDRPSWYPKEKITARQAIESYTGGAAYACCFDDIVGHLAVGKRADFVVLSDDILAQSPDEIASNKVLMTVIDGRAVYGHPG